MFFVMTISLVSGLFVLVTTWALFGLWAFIVASAVASVSGLLASFLLAHIRKDKRSSAPVHTKIPQGAIPDRPANNPKHPVPSAIEGLPRGSGRP
jgi:hypothetical protein